MRSAQSSPSLLHVAAALTVNTQAQEVCRGISLVKEDRTSVIGWPMKVSLIACSGGPARLPGNEGHLGRASGGDSG